MKKKHQSPEFLVICQDEANAKFFVASISFQFGGGGTTGSGGWSGGGGGGGGGVGKCGEKGAAYSTGEESSDGGDMW